MIDVFWSLIFGCLAAIILFYTFNNNAIYRGPNSKHIKSKIYKTSKTGKCYILKPRIYLCPKN